MNSMFYHIFAVAVVITNNNTRINNCFTKYDFMFIFLSMIKESGEVKLLIELLYYKNIKKTNNAYIILTKFCRVKMQ